MTSTSERPTTAGALPAFARGPVLALAAAVGLLLTAVSGRYGYFGDELYFLAAGHHLAWSYVDQPPGVPLLALAMDTLAPGSVAVLRIPATLATVAGLVLTALLARELGGGRRAQLVAAGAFATSPVLLGGGHLLATSTIDPPFWVAVTYLLVRWLRTRADRLLLVGGVLTAIDVQVKLLIPVLWVVLVAAVLAVGPRALLARPALWAGLALAVVSTVPTFAWQATHGWPLLAMAHQVALEDAYTGGMVGFLPYTLLITGLLVGAVLAVHGVVVLLRDPALRFLGVTVLGVTAVFLVTGGRVYYLAGLFPLLWAASAARIEAHRPAVWWRWVPTWPALALSAVLLVGFGNVVPVLPASHYAGQPPVAADFLRDEIGWQRTVPEVVAAWRAAPPGTVVVTSTYWVASALQRYAPQVPAYSPNRGAYWFGTPPESATSVVYVGDVPARVPYFTSVRRVGVLDNGEDVNNNTQGDPISLLEGRTQPWSVIWPRVESY